MELSNNPFDNLDFSIPELTSASIEQYIPQLQTNWEIGQQLATLEGIPYSRIYRQLSLGSNPYSISLVNLGAYSPEYEGSFYYLVSQKFQEISYSSSQTTGEDSWLRWRKVTTNFRQEITYLHKSIGSLNWIQPSVGQILTPISSPYTLSVDAGKALSVVFSISPANESFEIRLKNTANATGTLATYTSSTAGGTLTSSNILLTEPIIEIKLINPNNVVPIEISLTFYGQYAWRAMVPLDDESEQVLLHSIDIPISSRMKPPGLSGMPDYFWNSTPGSELKNFDQRQSNNPVWI